MIRKRVYRSKVPLRTHFHQELHHVANDPRVMETTRELRDPHDPGIITKTTQNIDPIRCKSK